MLCLVSMPFAAFFDRTAMSLALPTMAKDLHVPLEQIQRIITLYLVILIATALFFGRLGDVIGKGKVYLLGAIFFGAGALIAAISPNIIVLYLGRILEGIGSGAGIATSQGILTEIYPANKRGKMLGIYTVSGAIGMIISTAFGGFIISSFGWRAIFIIDFIVAVFAILTGFFLLPKGNYNKQKIDFIGSIVLATSIIIFFLALFDSNTKGFSSPLVLGGLIGGIILAILFGIIESKVKNPILDFTLYKEPVFSLSFACVIARYIVTSGIYIFIPIYLQDLRGLTPGESGIAILIMPITLALISPISGSLGDKYGPALVSFIGLVVMSLGTIIFFFLSPTTPIWLLIVMLGVIGIGSGAFSPPNSSIMLGSAPKEKLGIASSANGFAKNLGSAIGVSIIPRILYAIMGNKVGYKVTGYIKEKPLIFTDSLHLVYLICFAILIISVILAGIRIYSYRKKISITKTKI